MLQLFIILTSNLLQITELATVNHCSKAKVLLTLHIDVHEPTNQPFTAEEIKSAITSLRNNRSARDDKIKAEMLKSAPDILC